MLFISDPVKTQGVALFSRADAVNVDVSSAECLYHLRTCLLWTEEDVPNFIHMLPLKLQFIWDPGPKWC